MKILFYRVRNREQYMKTISSYIRYSAGGRAYLEEYKAIHTLFRSSVYSSERTPMWVRSLDESSLLLSCFVRFFQVTKFHLWYRREAESFSQENWIGEISWAQRHPVFFFRNAKALHNGRRYRNYIFLLVRPSIIILIIDNNLPFSSVSIFCICGSIAFKPYKFF